MIKRKSLHTYEYCPHCHRTTEHIIAETEVLCKRCGRKFKRLNPRSFADLNKPTETAHAWTCGLVPHSHRKSKHERKETSLQEVGEHLWGERR